MRRIVKYVSFAAVLAIVITRLFLTPPAYTCDQGNGAPPGDSPGTDQYGGGNTSDGSDAGGGDAGGGGGGDNGSGESNGIRAKSLRPVMACDGGAE